ncbi:MAG: Asp-tRNA(Asn)/Glu-tRNA(Gln) amidotransferase subunit GatC [Phycisphaerales bacterium]
MADDAQALPVDDVRRIARLARLELRDDEVVQFSTRLGATLGYIERLRELDLEGVEPLTHPLDQTNRLGDDEVGPTLDTEALMKIAPDRMPPFVKVPKVLGGDEGSA